MSQNGIHFALYVGLKLLQGQPLTENCQVELEKLYQFSPLKKE